MCHRDEVSVNMKISTQYSIQSCILFTATLLRLTNTVRSVSVDLHVNTPTLKTGGDIEIRCQAHRKHPNDLTQIIKSRVVYMAYDHSYNTTVEGPFDICNGTWLNPAIAEVTKRYRVTKETSDNLFVRITGAVPEDGGSWQCRVLSDAEGLLAESDPVEITVVGPMTSLSLLSSLAGQNFSQVPPDGVITMQANRNDRLGCEVKVTNVAPKVTVTAEKGGEVLDVTRHFMHEENTLIIDTDGGLINVHRHIRYTEHKRLGYAYNQHTVRCRAELQFYTPLVASAMLNITFGPEEIFCQPRIVDSKRKVEQVPLVCHVRANPTPTLTWYYPNGTKVKADHADVNTQINGDLVTTILTLYEVDPAQYGAYKLKADNYFGTQQAQVMLTDELGTGGQSPLWSGLRVVHLVPVFLHFLLAMIFFN